MNEESAILMAKSKWWEHLAPREAALIQLQEEFLMMPFHEFHSVVSWALKRSVLDLEFRNPQKLIDEVRAAK